MLDRKEPYHVMRLIENDTVTETSNDGQQAVTIAGIWEAHKLLKPRLHHTPLTLSRTLHDLTGADIYLKAENMQRSGCHRCLGRQSCARSRHRSRLLSYSLYDRDA